MKKLAITLLLLGAFVSAAAADVLDGLIFGIKCASADDPEACKERSKREADESRERLRQGASAPDATSPSRPAGQPAATAEQCHTVKASGKVDIDVAYASGKTRFGFMNLDEKKHFIKHSGGRVLRLDDGFRHTAVQGTLYDLWDHVSIEPPHGQRLWFTARLRLMKAERGTDLEARYCVQPSDAGMTGYLEQAFAELVEVGK